MYLTLCITKHVNKTSHNQRFKINSYLTLRKPNFIVLVLNLLFIILTIYFYRFFSEVSNFVHMYMYISVKFGFISIVFCKN